MDLINIDLAVRVTYHTTGVGRGSQLVVGGFMMDSSTGDLPLIRIINSSVKSFKG